MRNNATLFLSALLGATLLLTSALCVVSAAEPPKPIKRLEELSPQERAEYDRLMREYQQAKSQQAPATGQQKK